MDEKGQGAVEYLLMLAAVLAAVSAAFAFIFGTFDSLSSSVENNISEIGDDLLRELTGV